MSLPLSRRSLSGGIKRVALMHGCTFHGNSEALLDAFQFTGPDLDASFITLAH